MSDQEVLNNDNQLIGRVMIHNVGDGVHVQLIYVGGAVSESGIYHRRQRQ